MKNEIDYNKGAIDKLADDYAKWLENKLTETNQALQLLQPDVIKSVCKHENITRSDGLDECLDCGARNY